MKLFKKLALLASSLVLSASVCIGVAQLQPYTNALADTESSSTSTNATEEFVYKIRVQSVGGFGLRNVIVNLYDGDEEKYSVLTNSQGDALFTGNVTPGVYDVRLEDVPVGWSIADETIKYQTSAIAQTNITVPMKAQLITEYPAPLGKTYALGDVMYDFSVETCDGATFKLSEVLKEKRMVLLNFWATWCGPCKQEFPYLQNAYNLYESTVGVLAASKDDDQAAVKAFKDSNGYPFPMAGKPRTGGFITDHFNLGAIPVSVVIDRYGVVSYIHTGAIPSTGEFTALFDKFVGDNYVQTVISDNGTEGGGNGGADNERLEPTVSPPALAEVASVMTGDSTDFTYSWEKDDKYSWPWEVVTTEADGKFLRASNKGFHNSYAILNVEFTAAADTVLQFDMQLSTELQGDFLYVMVDGAIIHKLSGERSLNGWETFSAYVFESAHVGKHTLTFIYMKDANLSYGEDEVKLRNLTCSTPKATVDNADISLDVFRYAATGYNDPTTPSGKAAATAYKNYITPVFNADDGYYHVNSKNGPYLFADLMNATLWNQVDVWQLAYNGLLVYNGVDLQDLLEDYAWAANHSTNGYVPVTADLRELLHYVSKIPSLYGEKSDKAWHANEWLETCIYYDHYGTQPAMGDPTKGITFDGAIPLEEGTSHIVCDRSLVPLGIKHKFTPTKTGAYRIQSLVPEEYEDTDSCYDPQAWVIDSDRTTFLAYSDDTLNNANVDNFDICLTMNAGETYYLLFAFFLNDVGEFDLSIEYLGETYTNLLNCAVGPYSFNPVTNATYVPTAKQTQLFDDGYYYVVDENGEKISKVYLDLTHVTYLFPGNTLQNIIESAEEYSVEKRLFYLDGVDYTETMQTYLFYAILNERELYGMVAVDEELMEILLKLTKYYDGFGGIKNSWQMACYYYTTV